MPGELSADRQRPVPVYFDGGCRPNPGPIEVAVVVRGRTCFFDELGEGGSEAAEWLALCQALELAQRLGLSSFDLVGDSRSVVDQANGRVAPRGAAARRLQDRFEKAVAGGRPRRIRWIKRQQNLAGIALDRRRNEGRSATSVTDPVDNQGGEGLI